MSQPTEARAVKVVLVEDHPMFRERLATLINKELNMTVCGEADNIQQAQEIIAATEPDIAIVDITLRGSSGLELIKNLKAQGIRTPVLVLSMHDENLYAERVLRAGAKGYITKDEASSKVIQAIRRVLEGGIYVSENVTGTILQRIAKIGAPVEASGVELLTDRELEVFQLVGRGRNSREIAERLHLGETTVDTYRARIKEKLHIRNAAELYSRAAQWVQEKE
jgi:DNA-binding NarL/FixJ family response regulator